MFKKTFTQVAMCCVAASTAWAQVAEVQIDDQGNERRRVIINVDDKALVNDTNTQSRPNKKWIGVGCRQVSDTLRAHLDLPQGIGLVIEQVMPQSPAEEVGLEQHDILIQANERKLGTVEDLVNAIRNAGDDAIDLTWLHEGQKVIKSLTPADRPAEQIAEKFQFEGNKIGDLNNIRAWVEKLEGGKLNGNQNMKFKIMGPGFQMSQSSITKVLPDGTKIEIERDGEGPAAVKVSKGKSSWETTEDKLDILPDDARAEVEKTLEGNGINIQIDGDQLGNGLHRQLMEQFKGMRDIEALNLDLPWPKMNERFDEMNRRMEEMMERLERLQQRQAPLPEDDNDA